MTTQSLKFKSIAISSPDLRGRLFKIMLFAGALLVLCYIIILSNMVWNIVARRSIETQISSLTTNVGELELKYMSLSDKVDLNLAYSMGFSETSNKEFTDRKPIGVLLVAPNEL